MTIHDEQLCEGQGNSATVTPPFSIAITGLRPNSRTGLVFVTDKDATPDIIYGPFVIPNVDIRGTACMNVNNAPSGHWKIEVVEQGSGFTDSKVFTVVGGLEPTTTTAPTSTTEPTTTTTEPTTTTTEPTTTTTEPPAVHKPWSELPWVLGLITSVPSGPAELPRTGGSNTAVLVAMIALSVGILALVIAGRLRAGSSA